MGKFAPHIEAVAPENLLIDLRNPRYDPKDNQREALQTMVQEQGTKLANLAEDMADKGLNQSELPIVTPTEEKGVFVVLEGNRRIAALKLLTSRDLRSSLKMPAGLSKRLKTLAEETSGLPAAVACFVTTREDANHWILLRHTGENAGVGIIPWDGKATHRFRGSSVALQAIDLVEKGNYLDEEARARLPKIAITNVERVLGTPDARKLIGVDVQQGALILLDPQAEALGRLALLVVDVLRREVRVTDLDSHDQRVEYAQGLAKRPLPKPVTSARSGQKEDGGTDAQTSNAQRRAGAERRALVPRRLKLAIQQNRISRIIRELQDLDARRYTNSCAVMLRVFIEMSVEDYASRHRVSLVALPKLGAVTKRLPAELKLRKKLLVVADHLEKSGTCDRQELYGIRSCASQQGHVLSVDSWHAYVHNRHYNPTATDLKTCWDNIQPFVEGLFKS